MRYRIVLSDKGDKAYKGGNVEPMSKALVEFDADSKRQAAKRFDAIIAETVGSGSAWLFDYEESYEESELI